jgi:hypothetical protein
VIEAAVQSADPDGYVVHWLRENAFPADRRGDLLLFYLRDDALRARPVGVLAGDALLLREVALPEHAVTAGDAVLAEMTWSIQRAPGIDLVASLGLVGTDGTTWAERVYQPGEVVTPPSTWAEGQIVTDRQALLIPVDMPRGTYTLYVNVRRADSGEALMPAGGEAGDPWIVLGTIEVERQ